MNRLSTTSKVEETTNVNKVNALLNEGWYLLSVGCIHGNFSYSLGK